MFQPFFDGSFAGFGPVISSAIPGFPVVAGFVAVAVQATCHEVGFLGEAASRFWVDVIEGGVLA